MDFSYYTCHRTGLDPIQRLMVILHPLDRTTVLLGRSFASITISYHEHFLGFAWVLWVPHPCMKISFSFIIWKGNPSRLHKADGSIIPPVDGRVPFYSTGLKSSCVADPLAEKANCFVALGICRCCFGFTVVFYPPFYLRKWGCLELMTPPNACHAFRG